MLTGQEDPPIDQFVGPRQPPPVSPWTKAQTIGASRVGERYAPSTTNEIMASPNPLSLLTGNVLGPARPPSVATQDPYGIQAAEMGAGPWPMMAAPIKAFHASPYDFSRFDPRKIGSGQGAGSYGHGLYFAEHPAVMEEYYREFAGQAPYRDPRKFAAQGQQPLAHRYEVDIHADPEQFLDWDLPLRRQSPHVQEAMLPSLQQEDFTAGGQRLIDFTGDTTLGVKLQHELRQNGGDVRAALDTLSTQGNDRWKAKVDQARQLDWSTLGFGTVQRDYLQGGTAYNAMASKRGIGPAVASTYLHERGVPGLRYLDQGSRDLATIESNVALARARRTLAQQAGDVSNVEMYTRRLGVLEADLAKAQQTATRNYVMFPGSEGLIDILRKYGILPPLAGAAAYGASQQNQVGTPPPGVD